MSRTPERYASATSSAHLRVESAPCDIDTIIAAGWVKVGLSTELYRLMVQLDGVDKRLFMGRDVDPSLVDWVTMAARLSRLPPARRELMDYAHWLARARFPEVRTEQVLGIAMGVMAQILLPTCPGCEGREYELIPGTPNKSHRVCQVCKGSGVRQLKVAGGRAGYEFAAALQAGVESKLSVLFEVMSRHLRNQLDLQS